MVGKDKIAFIRQLIAYENTTNEQVKMVATKIAEYYTKLLLEKEKERIPDYFARLCYEYKGIQFKKREAGVPVDVVSA